jgi:hypothetical protein
MNFKIMSIRKTGEKSLRKHEKNEISNAMSLRTDPEKIEKKQKSAFFYGIV